MPFDNGTVGHNEPNAVVPFHHIHGGLQNPVHGGQDLALRRVVVHKIDEDVGKSQVRLTAAGKAVGTQCGLKYIVDGGFHQFHLPLGET